MDPLSDVLSLLRPRSFMSGGVDHGGDWAISFSGHCGIKFQAIVSGGCWLAVEGLEPIRVEAGDCYLLPRGLPFRLASDLSLPAVDGFTALGLPLMGQVRVLNGGGGCFSIGGHFTFEGRHAEILLAVLPPVVHLRRESDKAAMRWSVERLMLELREPQPGGDIVAQQLTTMLMVQVLRLHVGDDSGAGPGVGWLSALADRQVSAAMAAMHAEPGRRWTIEALAERAAMSRSSFALKFKRVVGASPMEYLTRWRMMLAADRLANGRETIATLAPSLGYESESAFSTAFKRVMGCAPRNYGRGAEAAPHAALLPA